MASTSFLSVKEPQNLPNIMVAITPTPAASVGVAMPNEMLPIIAITTIKKGQIATIFFIISVIFSCDSLRGANNGFILHLK